MTFKITSEEKQLILSIRDSWNTHWKDLINPTVNGY
jgi:hypothetical protein